ncbi:HAD family hydrolase [Periweissella fabalis]|uniref:HAD hydrolase-like protein n=1 Tax=Periweissella fabalis TaxID=1070421 RepID=A0A7X6S2S9_9LACO|nr:HAD family hydrolase [Periweissella fabalis]MCM0598682.1 HAD hydrolase-like protein [Periweissella fabalis]NKZ24335.1 HAD hydrolase-like protein [Periweissella fabalis]
MLRQFKRKLATYPIINYDQLWSQLIDAEVVIFDIFNTLLKSSIPNKPSMFMLIANIWQRENQLELKNFVKLRLNAESKAHKKYGNKTTLANIYEFLSVPKSVMEVEIYITHELNQANAPMQMLYQALKRIGKRLIVIADTNIDKQVVAQLLAQNGYSDYEKLYVANEYGSSKKNSLLFERILKELNIKPNKVLHVGDEWQADYFASLGAHIKCFKIPRVSINSLQPLIANDAILNTIQLFSNNMLDKYEFDSYQEFGYSAFGPVILGFSQWIDANVASDYRIFFFARDGYILQEAYQKLYPNQVTDYLYVSRRALQVPLLKNSLNIEDVLNYINLPREFTASQFLKACGIDKIRMKDSQSKVKYTKDITSLSWLNALYQEYKIEIITNAQLEFDYLKEYLLKIGFTDKVAVVDIGWHGNKQRALEKFCQLADIPVIIKGYYFGVAKTAKRDQVTSYGFWFDQVKNQNQNNLARPINGILEFLFSAKHGTTIRYDKSNGQVQPILAPYEFEGNHDLIVQGQLLKTIRQAALQFVVDFTDSKLNPIIQLAPKSAMKLFELNVFKPSNDFMRRFGHFVFIDRNVKYLVTPRSNWYYCFHPGQFKRDFLLSRWAIGFLKRIFKLPINYFNIYALLMKYFDKMHY